MRIDVQTTITFEITDQDIQNIIDLMIEEEYDFEEAFDETVSYWDDLQYSSRYLVADQVETEVCERIANN